MRNKVLATIVAIGGFATLAAIPASAVAAACPPGDTGTAPYCTVAPATAPTSTASKPGGLTTPTPTLSVGLKTGSSSQPISSFTLKLPAGFSFNKKNYKKDVKLGGGSAKTESATAKQLSVKLKSASHNVTIRMAKGSLALSAAEQKLAKAGKLKSLKVTGSTVENGKTEHYTITIKI